MSKGAAPLHARLLYVIGETSAREVDIETVGSKAHNLMRMRESGLAVPPGFVLGTGLCRAYHDGGKHLGSDPRNLVADGVGAIERETGSCFGARRRPLLVAIRSGAAVSMPGMLDTILDVGLSDATLPGLLRATGDPVFVWDSYRRLIQAYAEVVEGCPPAPFAAVLNEAMRQDAVPAVTELDVAALRGVVHSMQDVYRSVAGHPFPQDPLEQLLGAVEAVLRSWNGRRAVEYRTLEGLTDLAGTAVTVQAMVFGNMGATSGSGVGFTRDPATGEARLYADFLLNAQGEDVVAGRHTAGKPESPIGAMPGLAHELQTISRQLEALFRDAQDFEFTVQEGNLWMLQTRTAKRTPWAALRIACDLVEEGLIEPTTAVERLAHDDLDSISRLRITSGDRAEPIGRGIAAGVGVACGRLALEVYTAQRYAEHGEPVVLVRGEASTEDIAALAVCHGLVTATGARTSHAAVVARQLGVVCVVGCAELSIDTDQRRLLVGKHELSEGELVTVDGGSGLLYRGELEARLERPQELINRVPRLAGIARDLRHRSQRFDGRRNVRTQPGG